MPISRVILNASPIICLMKAGLIEILPAVYKEILVPQEVKREIFVKGATNLNEEVLTSCQWIGIVGDITIAPQVASWSILTSGP